MSTLPSNDLPRKQTASVYTVMLALSALFLLIAVIAMFIELGRYAPQYWNTSEARPNVQVSVPPASDVRFLA